MATKLDIYNTALIACGSELISDINASSKRAVLLNTRYTSVKNKLLKSHPWKFATKRVELTATGTTPVYEYDNQFNLPTDFLALLGREDEELDAFTIENSLILANDATIKIKYIYEADEDDFPDDFSDALAFKLANDVCNALTQDRGVKDDIRRDLDICLSKAKNNDAFQGDPQDLDADEFLNARL